jgi:hypothetical protein
MRGSRWGTGLAVLVAVLLAAAGCGGDPTARPTRDASVPQPTSPPPTSDGNGPLVPSLPTLGPTKKETAKPVRRVFGADASWPQCPKGMGIPEKRTEGKPMPTAAARFVILGLTNGPSFVANPCLADQLAWVGERHLMVAAYSIVSYPDDRTLAALRSKGPYDGSTRLGALRNVGYQAARFNVDTMRRVGLRTPVVWIDVEPVLHFVWSSDVVANGAVVQGVARGYRDAGLRIGFYSIGSLWTRVVGSLRFGEPEWRPAGARGLGEALNRCAPDWSFQGGVGVLGQWIEDGRDRDVTCPGAVTDLRQWFHQT